MKIKCVIWDLDNTLWEGILNENQNVSLKPKIEEILKFLNKKGIIQSIVSKNYEKDAINKLKDLNIEQYFVFPQISYTPKNILIKNILEFLNIDEEFIVYVDDDEFEINEVKEYFPNINIYKAEKYLELLNDIEFQMNFLTEDSIKRTEYLKTKEKRIKVERNFIGPTEEFMKDARTQIILHSFKQKHLARVLELLERTNKYNNIDKSIVNKEYILKYINENNGKIIVFELNDKYGEYGTIGAMFFRILDQRMFIDTFCISCRVLGRGIPISIFSNIINKLFKEKRILEVVCKINYTKKNRESIVLLNLLNFKLNKVDNNIFEFILNKEIEIINKEFINVIYEEKLENG